MRKYGSDTAKPRPLLHTVVFRSAAALFVLLMLSLWMVCGMFAKYVVTDSEYDAARMVSTGIKSLELWEHEAEETYPDSGIYELDRVEEVDGNDYQKVLPGVDIPKDPFIRLELVNPEVSYELFLTVTESELFPEYVTYSLRECWQEVSKNKNGTVTYQYIDPETEQPLIFRAGTSYTFTGDNVIPVLKDDRLYVGEHYVGKDENGNDQPFTLTFEAYLRQIYLD